MVNFHNHEGEAGASDVFVSVNGTAYTFPREIDVKVPIEVLGAIDNAVITKFSRSSKGEDISRDVKRYPYSKVQLMNYLTLCDDLLKETGVSEQGVFSVKGQGGMPLRAVKWVRRAWVEIQGLREWRFLWCSGVFNTVIGQIEYHAKENLALTPSLKSWVTDKNKVRLVDDGRSSYLKYVKWESWGLEEGSTQRPYAYTIKPDNTLVLNTAPDKLYQVYFEYFRTPQILTENTEIPIVSEEYHEVILYKAMTYLAAEQDAPEVYQDSQRHLNIWLSAMKSKEIPEITFGSGPIA